MALALIGLGANLGDRQATLERAIELLAAAVPIQLRACSRWLETAPVGGPADQPAYLNGAAVLETSLEPLALLDLLQHVEQQLGRRREIHWGPRTVDLDVLLYDEQVVQTPRLTVPHPRMAFRRFVLQPAAEIAPDMVHPQIGWTLARLWEHLQFAVPYVAIAGGIGAGKSWLARELAAQVGATLLAEPLDDELLTAFYADPAGQAWRAELEFLNDRQLLLAANDGSDPARFLVSDFWFDQSLAFASVWLDEERFKEFRSAWEAARETVTPPKLLAVLDAPGEQLYEQVRRRGRPYEDCLDANRLEQLRQAVADLAREPGHGPVLWLPANDPAAALTELRAAVEAMK
jgi:2-amino-4-hydroxy-6-hydroxymethyldihydropteridine diphosphokinase